MHAKRFFIASALALSGGLGGALTAHAATPEQPAPLLERVRAFAAPRYQEGYQRGIHDDDALAIVRVLAPIQDAAGLLVYGPAERALAKLYWHLGLREESRHSLARRARSALTVIEGAPA